MYKMLWFSWLNFELLFPNIYRKCNSAVLVLMRRGTTNRNYKIFVEYWNCISYDLSSTC